MNLTHTVADVIKTITTPTKIFKHILTVNKYILILVLVFKVHIDMQNFHNIELLHFDIVSGFSYLSPLDSVVDGAVTRPPLSLIKSSLGARLLTRKLYGLSLKHVLVLYPLTKLIHRLITSFLKMMLSVMSYKSNHCYQYIDRLGRFKKVLQPGKHWTEIDFGSACGWQNNDQIYDANKSICLQSALINRHESFLDFNTT